MSTILITGASSGIGAALALHYSTNKNILILSGRNEERLKKTANSCKELGAEVYTKLIEVTNEKEMAEWIKEVDAKTPVDILIANAGISAGSGIHGETSEQASAIFATNVGGVLNTIHPAIACMKKRRHGQIAIISSVAGMIPIPSAPAYSASKACVTAYALSLRGALVAHGIKINTVCPGYIKTPMTEKNKFPMPFIMGAEKAAKIIANGLEKNKAVIAFPLPMVLLIKLSKLAPANFLNVIFSKLPKKASSNF